MRRRIPRGQVEDLTLEVFERAWKNFSSLSDPQRPLPWLYGIGSNVIREFYRKDDKTPQLVDITDHEPAADEFVSGVDLNLDINRAMGQIKDSEREILTLFAWEGLSQPEIAEALDISPENVRVRLHRARTHLAKALHNESTADESTTGENQ